MTSPVKKTLRRPDEAKRMRDVFGLHQVALSRDVLVSRRCWVAIRLSDGGSDNTIYDTREDAIDHQLFPTQCGYMPVPLERLDEFHCDSLLWYWEKMYDAGHKPLHNRPIIVPNTFDGMIEDILAAGGDPFDRRN